MGRLICLCVLNDMGRVLAGKIAEDFLQAESCAISAIRHEKMCLVKPLRIEQGGAVT